MGYTGVPYNIKSGDTLWDIAARKLGDPYAWPRIYAFNNQPDVVNAGAKKIVDPDLIYADATLMLPIVADNPPLPVCTDKCGAPSGKLKDQIPSIQMPMSIAYDLKGDPLVLDYGTFIARIRQKGRILVNPGTKVPLTGVLNGSWELGSKTTAQTSLSTLVSSNKVSFDPTTKSIKFTNKMIVSANNINAPKTAVGIEFSSSTGMPVLKAEIAYPELKGKIAGDSFFAVNYKIELEIEPKLPKPELVPIPVTSPSYNPAPSPTRAPETDWGDVFRKASTGALILAGIITVAYGASVFFSGGASGVAAPAYASTMTVILVGATATTIAVQQ
ncbi:LysM peptidoglycan-binding domain-containing protein [Yoonia sp. 2307UL14-13]|uniref:LysM peptidoglycan-binding domain-containing protein n=1 Tax=Yoonia sp. 2307UL14-13 TaxID=3126506 RepID=UPI0030A9D4F8